MNIDEITGNEPAICFWNYDEDGDTYVTGCGDSFEFMAYGPEENDNFDFCPYCGCILEVAK